MIMINITNLKLSQTIVAVSFIFPLIMGAALKQENVFRPGPGADGGHWGKWADTQKQSKSDPSANILKSKTSKWNFLNVFRLNSCTRRWKALSFVLGLVAFVLLWITLILASVGVTGAVSIVLPTIAIACVCGHLFLRHTNSTAYDKPTPKSDDFPKIIRFGVTSLTFFGFLVLTILAFGSGFAAGNVGLICGFAMVGGTLPLMLRWGRVCYNYMNDNGFAANHLPQPRRLIGTESNGWVPIFVLTIASFMITTYVLIVLKESEKQPIEMQSENEVPVDLV